jgi:magnesium and cobalt exporter, CNNM family
MEMSVEGINGIMSLYGLLALASFLLSMLQIGALAALVKLSGLFRNGLLDEDALPGWVTRHLSEPRSFIIKTGTLNLAATIAGGVFGILYALSAFPEVGSVKLSIFLLLVMVIAWTAGGIAMKSLATGPALMFLRIFTVLMAPVYWLLGPWAALQRLAMVKAVDISPGLDTLPHLSADEIRDVLRQEDGEVNLEDGEMEMIQSIFNFHGMAVKEIMVPRIDIVTLEASMPAAEALLTVTECRHSRIPVHEGSVDKINGLLYAKDLLSLVKDGTLVSDKTVGDLIRPAYFIPESKKLDEVLAEFRWKHIHMAVIIDEYGGTAGIVTMEDVLEEIVGEIEDEFDEAETLYRWLDAKSLRVDPKIDLEDLQDVLGVELPLEEGSETLAGLVYEAAGKVPEAGDQVNILDLLVSVEDVHEQRIVQVKIQSRDDFPGFATSKKAGNA